MALCLSQGVLLPSHPSAQPGNSLLPFLPQPPAWNLAPTPGLTLGQKVEVQGQGPGEKCEQKLSWEEGIGEASNPGLDSQGGADRGGFSGVWVLEWRN